MRQAGPHEESWAAAVRAVGAHGSAGALRSLAGWAIEQARVRELDVLLVRAPLAGAFAALAAGGAHPLTPAGGPRIAVLEGSAFAFALAAASQPAFSEGFDLTVAGALGLPLRGLLARMGAVVPADPVLADLGFGEDRPLGPADEPALRHFLSAYRQEVMRAAIRARRGLFLHLLALGVREGQRVALLDVDGTGATFEAFAQAMETLPPVRLSGFDALLIDHRDVARRRARLDLSAMVDPLPHGGDRGKTGATLRLVRALLAPVAAEATSYAENRDGIVPLRFPPRGALAPEAAAAILEGLAGASGTGAGPRDDGRPREDAMAALVARLSDPATAAPFAALLDLP